MAKTISAAEARILVVEDDAGLCRTLRDRLRREGFAVELASTGEAALAVFAGQPFDLLVVDVMLPGLSGLEVCRQVRERDRRVGIIMLTALGQTADKLSGLGLGADDYVTKPFEFAELVARIRALLRRTTDSSSASSGLDSALHIGDVEVDLRRAEATRDGQAISLSATEFHLLRYLLEHRGAALSREELLAEVLGYDGSVATRTIDVHIANLRRKLEVNPRRPQHLVTIHGVGYKLR